MNTLTFLNQLRPALPMSAERPCTPASNSELRRWMASGSVLINGERVQWDEEVDYPVFSIVFFPKSEARKATLVWSEGVNTIIDGLLKAEHKGPEWVQLCEELNRRGGWVSASGMSPKTLGNHFLHRKQVIK